MKTWWLYMAECSDETIYTGITTDVQRRIGQHNTGHGAKYTATRRPIVLKACWPIGEVSEALKMEHRIKKLSRLKKLQVAKCPDLYEFLKVSKCLP